MTKKLYGNGWPGNSDPTWDFGEDGYIPTHMREGVIAYVRQGRPLGDFLRSVFENDLRMAGLRADGENRRQWKAWARLLSTEVPLRCWGSRKIVEEWIAKGGVMECRREEEK